MGLRFMDNIKDDFYYVKRILQSVEVLTRYLSNKSLEDFLNDGYLRDAVENRFTKMAEDTSRLSKEFKITHSEIPWGAISKIRNTICHDYDVVDADSLYKTIGIDFPVFRKNLLATIEHHYMNLDPKPFDAIENKLKTVEMRLYDEKRKLLKTGDLIVFINNETKKELIVEIVELKRFNSFDELYAKYRKKELGYKDNEIASPKDMNRYYSDDKILEYGVLAIEIKVF